MQPSISIYTPGVLSATLLLVTLIATAWFDIRERRIPNLLILNGSVLALLLALTSEHYGLAFALSGMLIGGALFLPHYFLGGMGAGDIKLMAMTGAFLGPVLATKAVFFTLLFGVVIALIRCIGSKLEHFRVERRLPHTAPPSNLFGAGQSGPAAQQEKDPGLPYAVAILFGTVAVILEHPVVHS